MFSAQPSFVVTNSDLLRLLADLVLHDARAPDTAFAQTLAHWLSLDDAITLRAVHASGGATHGGGVAPRASTLRDDFAQLRASLAASVDALALPASGRSRSQRAAPATEPAREDVASLFAPYRRAVLAHRRDVGARVRAFRATARAVLIASAPALATLAALDAVFEQSLAERETKLLARVPVWLEQRFAHWHQTHSMPNPAGLTPVLAAQTPITDTWLQGFAQEQKALLLAELDFRLQPTQGLVEALCAHSP